MWLYILLFIIGTIAGSFFNVIIYRVPKNRGIISGRSSCPKCRKVIPWYSLVPILSFLLQRGKCLHCKNKISWIYPIIESVSGIIFVIISLRLFNPILGDNWIPWLFYACLSLILLALLVIDLKHFILPDSLIISLVALFAIYDTTRITANIQDPLQEMINFKFRIAGIVFLGGGAGLLWLLSRGKAVGLGDGKLLAALGLIFGIKGGLVILYFALLLGMVAGIAILLLKKGNLKSKLAFGPFLAISGFVYLIFWQEIITYLNILILKATII